MIPSVQANTFDTSKSATTKKLSDLMIWVNVWFANNRWVFAVIWGSFYNKHTCKGPHLIIDNHCNCCSLSCKTQMSRMCTGCRNLVLRSYSGQFGLENLSLVCASCHSCVLFETKSIAVANWNLTLSHNFDFMILKMYDQHIHNFSETDCYIDLCNHVYQTVPLNS